MIKVLVSDSGQPLGKMWGRGSVRWRAVCPAEEPNSPREEPQGHCFFRAKKIESTVRTVNQFLESLG